MFFLGGMLVHFVTDCFGSPISTTDFLIWTALGSSCPSPVRHSPQRSESFRALPLPAPTTTAFHLDLGPRQVLRRIVLLPLIILLGPAFLAARAPGGSGRAKVYLARREVLLTLPLVEARLRCLDSSPRWRPSSKKHVYI